METVYVNTATVKEVSKDIIEPEIKPGDTILYQTQQVINLDGEFIIGIDYLPAKI